MPPRRLPPNTRIKDGYIDFRKLYNGKPIHRTWPASKERYAFEEIYRILGKINRNEDIFELEEVRITMTQAADTFWELHASKKLENDSFKSYLGRIKQYFGTAWFDSITHEEVQEFIKWVRETPFHQSRHKSTPPRLLATGTVNHHHRCLTSIFNAIPRWVELGKLQRVKLPKQRNPASLIPKMSEEEFTRTRVLSNDELRRLLEAAHPNAAKIIIMAVFTLLRYNDLRKATLKDNSAAPALRGIQAKTSKTFEIATNGIAIQALDFTNFRRQFRAAVKKAKIHEFQFRDLRRTGATYLFRKTNDLGLVQRRLGHASPAMTKKYLGILDTDNMRASEILGSILSSLNPDIVKELPNPNEHNSPTH
jgi:integrase